MKNLSKRLLKIIILMSLAISLLTLAEILSVHGNVFNLRFVIFTAILIFLVITFIKVKKIEKTPENCENQRILINEQDLSEMERSNKKLAFFTVIITIVAIVVFDNFYYAMPFIVIFVIINFLKFNAILKKQKQKEQEEQEQEE